MTSLLTSVLLFLCGLLPLMYLWIRHRSSYWARLRVPSIKPFPIFGNLKEIVLRKRNGSDHFVSLYNDPNAVDQPVVGVHLFLTPCLMIRDLDLIKQILVKDFNKFANRFASADPVRDGLGYHNLFMIKNPKWKELRAKLTPFFTSGKLKTMFPLITEPSSSKMFVKMIFFKVGNQLDNYLLSLDENESILNVRELSSSFTIDVIATIAFGVQANSLKSPFADFRRHARMLTTFTIQRALDFVTIFFFPKMVTFFRSKQFTNVVTNFFRNTISHVMNEREKSGLVRNDLIDILLAFKRADDFDGNMDVLVAQAAIFFSAGFHTSASAMTFTLYELSKNQEIQQRLRSEIQASLAKTNGQITYEMINEMEYMEMVLDETLRLYPPVPFLDRQCVLPEGETEYSLKPYSDFAIPHGMPVSIPFFAIQRDPKYFEDPLRYDPERFSPTNRGNIVPFSYMPFGEGPRSCIGDRLAKIQSKIGLINILRNHNVVPCDQTPAEMVLDNAALITQEKGKLYIKFVRDPLM